MFPSTINGENQFTQFQPSFYSSTSFVGLNGNGNDLHRHHDLLVHHIPDTAAPASETALNDLVGLAKPTLSDQDMKRLNGDHHHHHCASLCNFPKMRGVKKDRHSKIVTAQGPRDRRVRLSIDIAQKFFGLQDMLGFDKASKTLDWLLTKSKTAIEELVKMKHMSTNDIQSSVSECEVVMGIEAAENGGDSDGKPLENSTKVLQAENQPQKAARESSRANARARARERTRKKMCTMTEKLYVTSPSAQNQSLPDSSQAVASKRSGSPIGYISTIQEPLLINRKMEPSIFGLQPNLIVSNDAKSEDHFFPYNNTGNWDTTSSIARSSMYAMANISSSKVLQLCGIPFGSINNNGQH